MDWRKEKQLKQKAQEYYEKGLSYNQVYIQGYADGYAKAVDEFVKEIEAEYDNDGCPNVADYLDYKISTRDLFRIAEQLKEGAE